MRFRPSQPKVLRSTLYNILTNIFYTGDFILKGTFYKGKHEPIISLSLFEKAQQVFQQVNRPKKTKKDFAFAGLMLCGHCGCSITGQIQKGKYIYYHCSNGKGNCGDKYIREEVIAEQFEDALKKLKLSKALLLDIKDALKESHSDEIKFHASRVQDLQSRYNTLTKRIDAIYEDKLDGKIPEELWFRKNEEYKKEMAQIEDSLRQHTKANFNYVESGVYLLELANNAHQCYSQRSIMEQRQMLNFLLSNCTLKAGKLDYIYKTPFDMIAEGVKFEKVSG